jgi:branched-chain amino acid transport system substrate-binding protein
VATQLAVAAAVLLGVSGCSKNSGSGESGPVGTALTVYSSLPLQGPHAADAQAIINGEKLALVKAGGRVGGFTVRYVSLDDSTAASKGWDVRQAAKNARTAVQDRTAIAFLGDFDPGATAITLPTLNEASILQITPATTLVGLTREQGGDKGEPDKYYPTGTRTFGRVIQADDVQAAAQLDLQREQGCRTTYLLHDMEAYGKSLTDLLALMGPQRGQTVTDGEGIDVDAKDFNDQAKKAAKAGADCLFFGGTSPAVAARLFTDMRAVVPTLQLFVPNLLATPEFATALAPDLAAATHVTSPTLPARLYPPAGRRFLRAYRKQFGAAADGYAMYGYEAMNAALESIRLAGPKGNDKRTVAKAFFTISNRASILGTYSVDKDGVTTLRNYAAYGVNDGKLVFERVLRVPAT